MISLLLFLLFLEWSIEINKESDLFVKIYNKIYEILIK